MTSIRPVAPVPQPLVRLSRIALFAATLDLVTKAIATQFWSERALEVTSWLSLALVPNYGGAFGLSAGAYTWQLNLALTLAAIVFVIPVTRDLTAVDKDAPTALGLIVGGALGNLMSLLAPPAGVADFIAVHMGPTQGLVLNVADIAAYTGLAMIVRTGFRIAAALITQVQPERRPVGSVFTHKSEAARRQQRRVHIERSPELVVSEWDRVADLGVVRADAPPPAEDVTSLPAVRRRRSVEPLMEIPAPPMSRLERHD